jgi:hypothetical protein
MDVVQETKRGDKQKCAELAHDLIKIIRDVTFFEHDRCLIGGLTYETMMESASEEANLLCILKKFNVKETGHYAIDLYDYCTSYLANKLKKIMDDSMFDRSLEGIEGKVKLIENIFDYLDSIEEKFESFVSFNEKTTEVKQTN